MADSELAFSTRATAVEPSRSLISLAPGGLPIVGVTQRSYDNAIAQTITLATRGRTQGENAVYAAFLTAADLPDSTGVAGNLLKEPGITDDAIASEMAERLPGVPMVPSAVFVQNKYGPLGYALGRSGAGETCIYAWQRLMRGDSLFRPKSGAISIRLRICDPGATEASLLRLAYGYSLNATLARSGWNPVDDAPSPRPNLGEAGAPIYPVAQQGFEEAVGPRPASVRPKAARPVRASPAPVTEPAVPDKPLDGYPTVPPPTP